MEVVPWKPVLDVLALQLWSFVLECRRAPRAKNPANSVIILGGEEQSEQGPNAFGPEGLEFQAQQS
jgi:hypothetical protein